MIELLFLLPRPLTPPIQVEKVVKTCADDITHVRIVVSTNRKHEKWFTSFMFPGMGVDIMQKNVYPHEVRDVNYDISSGETDHVLLYANKAGYRWLVLDRKFVGKTCP